MPTWRMASLQQGPERGSEAFWGLDFQSRFLEFGLSFVSIDFPLHELPLSSKSLWC